MVKVICEKNSLNEGLQIVKGGLGNKPIVPILNNILISTNKEKNKLILTTTNLEIGLRTEIEVLSIEDDFSLTVPGKKMIEIISKLPKDKQIMLEKVDDCLKIKSGGSKYKLLGLSESEFPRLVELSPDEIKIDIDKNLFLDGINKTIYATAEDRNKPILSGVNFVIDKNLKLLSSDGYRVACKNIVLGKEVDNKNIIVPDITLDDVRQVLLRSPEESCTISFAKNQIIFICGNTMITSRLIEGKFPNIEKIVPKEFLIELLVNPMVISDLIDRISSIVDDSNVITLTIEQDLLKIAAQSSETGTGNEETEISYTGKPMNINFNYKYLRDAFKVLKDEQVNWKFSGELSPCVIETFNKDHFALIMPIKP